MKNTVQVRQNDDGSFTITYFDSIVGHMAPVRFGPGQGRMWRAISHSNGYIFIADTKDEARRLLLGSYA